MRGAFIYTVILVCLISCTKFLQVDPPIDRKVTEDVFASKQTAIATVLAVYSRMLPSGGGIFNGPMTLYPALSADEIIESVSANYLPFQNNFITPDFSSNNLPFMYSYRSIYQINSIIENLKVADALDDTLKTRLASESKFLRALNYFHLVNFYGAVPLTVTSDYKINGSLARTDPAEIYKLMTEDLTEASNNLSEDYYSLEKIRANKWSAKALLARVCLYKEDWQNAVLHSTEVINSNKYSLNKINEIFLNSSSESILQMSYLIGSPINVDDAYTFIPGSATQIPPYILRKELLDAFEPGDKRKAAWTKMQNIGVNTYIYPFKYQVKTSTATKKIEHLTLLRLGEQYLIRAEAYAQQGKLKEAIKDIDSIRQRAGLPLINDTKPTISQGDLLNAIYQERRVELFCELGHRWFDLKRTGRASAALSKLEGKEWQDTDVLYPIPKSEMLLNPFLKQNPGYQ